MAEQEDIQTLERGDIYFFYRPRVEEQPEELSNVQRFYAVLSNGDKYRLMILGHKRLPDPSKRGGRKFWGFVDKVSEDPEEIRDELSGAEYGTKTRGERRQPGARPAGEGVYRILRHGDHTHLVYRLELPHEPGEVQEEFRIAEEASYIISVANPARGAPQAAGLDEERQAQFPKKLMDVFRGRKFADADPPELLDYEGAEFLLIPASEDIEEELGIKLDAHKESLASADLFKDLHMDREKKPVEPLVKGEWK